MDRLQELKLLGFCGTLKESLKLIFSKRKIFSQIALALIIPLSLVFQANILTADFLSSKTSQQKDTSDSVVFDLAEYFGQDISDLKSVKWAAYWVLIEIAYYFFILILSLLCTSSVSYTVACVYDAKDIDFKKALAVVRKVWKRVFVTFLLSFAIVFVYEYIIGALLVTISRLLINGLTTAGAIISIVLLILFLAGSVYITIIWHLATVISVLEDSVYGIKAIRKSKNLIKGKFGVAVGMLVLFSVLLGGVYAIFEIFVVLGSFMNLGIRIVIGFFCLFLILLLILFGLVVQTVIYFVCKSHHNEIINLANLENYVPYQKATELQEAQLPV